MGLRPPHTLYEWNRPHVLLARLGSVIVAHIGLTTVGTTDCRKTLPLISPNHTTDTTFLVEITALNECPSSVQPRPPIIPEHGSRFVRPRRKHELTDVRVKKANG